MAVSGGWVGSSAVDETGQRWISAARSTLRLPAYGGWMSEMVGRSREDVIYVSGNDHNYNYIHLQNELMNRGTTPVKIIVQGHLAAMNTGSPCFNFPAELRNEYIHLYIQSNVMGRGGDGGGSTSHGGKNGGNAINNWIGGRLRIENVGAICGGGGGGGDVGLGGNNATVAGGSGGRPLGLGGGYNYGGSGGKTNGNNASYDSPGARTGSVNYGTNMGGAGGEVGSGGEAGIASGADNQTRFPGGAAGMAVAGTTPTWINRGNIYGATV